MAPFLGVIVLLASGLRFYPFTGTPSGQNRSGEARPFAGPSARRPVPPSATSIGATTMLSFEPPKPREWRPPWTSRRRSAEPCRRQGCMREVVNGLMYVLSTGCQWRAIPRDLPPKSTVYGDFDLWTWDGTLDRLHHALYVKCREAAGREASPTAAVIDSQSVKSAEKGGAASIRTATMPERRSMARSGIFSSTQ